MFSDLPLSDIIIVIISLVISIGFHEAMHAFVAYRLGDTTAAEQGRITLNPLKHIDLMTTILLPAIMLLLHLPPILIARPVPFDPERVRHGEYGAALMALAGPFTNLGLAVIAAIVIRVLGGAGDLSHVLFLFMILNVSLFVFNMLPIPPLDGSRLLYAFAPEPIQRVMFQIEQLGFVGIIVILVVLMPFLGPILTNVNQAITTFLLV
jgi:Zn-dependent protease